VVCTEGETIAVDRTMSWTGPGAPSPKALQHRGHVPCQDLVPARGLQCLGLRVLALIQNPNASPATCKVTYMIEGASPVAKTHTIPGNSRQSFSMASDIGSMTPPSR